MIYSPTSRNKPIKIKRENKVETPYRYTYSIVSRSDQSKVTEMAKTELEEAGLETDGMAESTAKLREEIKALSGVDIMENDTTFKSTYRILDELSTKWQNLTDIQRANSLPLYTEMCA